MYIHSSQHMNSEIVASSLKTLLAFDTLSSPCPSHGGRLEQTAGGCYKQCYKQTVTVLDE